MRPTRKRKRGQTLILFTLALPLMFMMVGWTVDLGWAYYRQQVAHAAAEAAALAGVAAAAKSSPGTITCGANSVVCQAATSCPNPLPNPAVTNIDVACLYSRDNGFAVTAGGRQNVRIAANSTSPPPTVGGVTVAYWVTATVAETVPQTFSAILGGPTATVSARATAASFPGGNGGCIYVMSPTGSGVTSSGTATVQTGCGVYVDSSSNAAVLLSGSAKIVATGGSSVNIVGNWVKSGSATISPTPNLGVTPAPDPFASLTPPPVGPCTSGAVALSGSQSLTLNPGVYCGAITLSGTSAITLNPGIYVLKSGINMSGGTFVTGNGVMLYDLSGGVSMSGTGGITLTPATSGPYQGVTIYQDRGNSSAATLSGGTTEQITGVVYMPKAALTYSGGSGASATSETIVVNSIAFSGDAYIKDPATTALTGGGSGIALIE